MKEEQVRDVETIVCQNGNITKQQTQGFILNNMSQ